MPAFSSRELPVASASSMAEMESGYEAYKQSQQYRDDRVRFAEASTGLTGADALREMNDRTGGDFF